jgi:hypothetical protein
MNKSGDDGRYTLTNPESMNIQKTTFSNFRWKFNRHLLKILDFE